MTQLARRYATAAWDVAQSSNATDGLLADVDAFCAAWNDSEQLRHALENPAFKNERAAVLAQLLTKAEAGPVATRLLHLLVEHERCALLDDVNAALRELSDAEAGKVRASIASAVALGAAQVARIEEVLGKRLGRPVVAEVQLDPSLVAGMVCRVGRLTFDSSLKKQLGQFAEAAGAGGASSPSI